MIDYPPGTRFVLIARDEPARIGDVYVSSLDGQFWSCEPGSIPNRSYGMCRFRPIDPADPMRNHSDKYFQGMPA